MLFLSTLALFASPALAGPIVHLREITRATGDVNPGSFIVKYKDETPKPVLSSSTNNIEPDVVRKVLGAGANVTHNWPVEFFNGIAGSFDTETLNTLRANPNVEYVAEDGIMRISAVQTNAPWGLQRLSQVAPIANGNPRALTFTYTFDDTAGAGVDVYVVDSGINTEHVEFEGRASLGAAFGQRANVDGNGHGTHCAGTIASKRFGVAKAANVVAVKVMNDDGSGATSDIISGLSFVARQVATTNKPSIVSMSIGGGGSAAMDRAVASLTAAGIHVVVAAGNEGVDAANDSPARAPTAITVGASNIRDQRASFSNFGDVVDIFAPGETITSTFIGSNRATNTLSGTSMACPHVAGLVATMISQNGNQTPAEMVLTIRGLASNGALNGVPAGTDNLLAGNGQKAAAIAAVPAAADTGVINAVVPGANANANANDRAASSGRGQFAGLQGLKAVFGL